MKPNKTSHSDYCEYLVGNDKLWKRVLNVQYPYRRAIEKMELGKTLEIGCGIGRVLRWLPNDSVGVDHNPTAIGICLSRGLRAYESQEFQALVKSEIIPVMSFDNLLLSHVLEHLEPFEQKEIIESYLPYLKEDGGVFIVTSQEIAFASDSTHKTFTEFNRIQEILNELNLEVVSRKSFPFPRSFGKYFKHNEFHVYAKLKS